MVSNLPSGTVTFLFTDIEGSTKLAQQYPAAMPALLRRHHAILHGAIQAHHGYVFQIVGDAFCAAFHTAPDAFNAALAAQRALQGEAWDPAPVTVRMGIHTGSAQVSVVDDRSGGYSGYLALAQTQGVMSSGHGGQVLLSGASAELVQTDLPEGVWLHDLGEHRLKGGMKPERLWQLVAKDLRTEFPPLNTLSVLPNNLPVQLNRFVGRERELSQTKELLADSHLLTLIGPGGTGKTRLANQLGAEALQSFANGAWLVELAPLADPALVLQTVAETLGLREIPGTTLDDQVKGFLCEKRLLLILDNCEHLVESCAQLADHLLHSCSDLKIISSSREALGITGETVYRVPPLGLPDSDRSGVETLAQSEAVQLFVERAAAVKPGFALNERNAGAVAQICRRLDGIPLALELAAARVAMLTPEQIAARLDDRFRLLTGGSRSALPRQQTLEALIDWSYELLHEQERTLFHRLAVFAGGWTFEAAESLWTQLEVSSMPSSDVQPSTLDLLEQLVNKSLVQVDHETLSGESRFNYLETIRQYARTRLLDSGEMETSRDAHLAYFSVLVQQASRELTGPRQAGWLQRLDDDLDNLRTAFDWALQRDPVLGLEMSGELALFWDRRGHGSEGLRWLKEEMERVDSLPPAQGESLLRRRRAWANALFAQGLSLIAQGAYDQAIVSLNGSVTLWREIGDQDGLAFPLSMLGFQYSLIGEMDIALQYAREAEGIANSTGDNMAIGLAMSTLAREKITREHDYKSGRAYAEEGARRLRLSGNEWFAHTAVMGLGLSGLLEGDLAKARSRLQETFDFFNAFGDRHFANVSRSGLAEVARAAADDTQATALFCDTAAEWLELGNRGGAARCLECLAFMALAHALERSGSDRAACERRAAILFGAAEAIRQASGAVMVPEEQEEYDRQLADFRGRAEPAILKVAWADGKAMTANGAIAFARQGLC